MQELENQNKSRFGSEAASAMYARLRSVSVENGIFKVYDLELTDTEVSLSLFNSFKLLRDVETGVISVFERDYLTGEWMSRADPAIMGLIPVWPIQNFRDALLPAIKGRILRKIYESVGFDAVLAEADKRRDSEYWDIFLECRDRGIEEELSEDWAHELADERSPDRKMLKVAKRAFANRAFGDGSGRKSAAANGFVSRVAVRNGLKGFRAAFFRHFRDPELFRAILAMDHKSMSLGDYLYFSRNRDAVLKVWAERRNLVPVLPYISMDRWAEDELFSVENWTSVNGLVAHDGFTRRSPDHVPSQVLGSTRLVPFGSERAFKWLAKSKNSVVKAWVRGHRDPRAADFMAEMNLPKQTPVLVVARTVSELSIALAKMDSFDRSISDHRQQILRLYRSYAAHWTERRGIIGYRAAIREMLYQNGTGDVVDYLINEGFRNNIPARNATWSSVLRRSEEWHAVHGVLQWGDVDDDFGDSIEKREWESLVGPLEVDGCSVKPLTDVNTVVAEGADMHHCVGGYALPCSKDRYRVFSIIEPDGAKSTLGISLARGTAEFDQVRGVCNATVSERVRRVAEYVTSMYAQAVYDAGIRQAESELRKEAA